MNDVSTAEGLINHFISLYRMGKFTKEDMNRELEFQKANYPNMYKRSIEIINKIKNK